MAVLWISGRTALFATAAAAGCTAALLRGRPAVAAVLLTTAVCSREETILLPLVAACWMRLLAPDSRHATTRTAGWLLAAVGIVAAYLLLRSMTGAMTPATAPAHYRLTLEPAVLLRNLAEYADRTATFSAAVLLLAAAILRPRLTPLDLRARAVVAAGALWAGVFLVPALLLPVRSSLYACLPSAGVCVAAAVLAERWWLAASARRRRAALYAAVVVPLLLWPVYRARTERWTAMAEFSSSALAALAAAAAGLPDDSDVLIEDDRRRRANMASAFSGLLREAFLLTTGRYMTFYVDPPIEAADERGGGAPVCSDCIDVRLVVRNGRLVRQPAGGE
jgi:hypothetical protein